MAKKLNGKKIAIMNYLYKHRPRPDLNQLDDNLLLSQLSNVLIIDLANLMKCLLELYEKGLILIFFRNNSYYCEITRWGIAMIEKKSVKTTKGEISPRNLILSKEEMVFEGI